MIGSKSISLILYEVCIILRRSKTRGQNSFRGGRTYVQFVTSCSECTNLITPQTRLIGGFQTRKPHSQIVAKAEKSTPWRWKQSEERSDSQRREIRQNHVIKSIQSPGASHQSTRTSTTSGNGSECGSHCGSRESQLSLARKHVLARLSSILCK